MLVHVTEGCDRPVPINILMSRLSGIEINVITVYKFSIPTINIAPVLQIKMFDSLFKQGMLIKNLFYTYTCINSYGGSKGQSFFKVSDF